MSTSSAPTNKDETFKSSCHCGKVQFEFQHPSLKTSTVSSCNCSLCNNRGYLFIYITDLDKNFKFTKGSWDDLTEYRFGARKIEHWFCPVCGSGLLEKWGNERMGINLRSVEGVEVDDLKIKKSDGRSD